MRVPTQAGAAGAIHRTEVENIVPVRVQTPEVVVAFVSFPAGSDSGYMTGQTPRIDGGLVNG